MCTLDPCFLATIAMTWVGIRGIYVNSSIMDEGAPVFQKYPLQDQGPIHSNSPPLDLFGVCDSTFGDNPSKNNHVHIIIQFNVCFAFAMDEFK